MYFCLGPFTFCSTRWFVMRMWKKNEGVGGVRGQHPPVDPQINSCFTQTITQIYTFLSLSLGVWLYVGHTRLHPSPMGPPAVWLMSGREASTALCCCAYLCCAPTPVDDTWGYAELYNYFCAQVTCPDECTYLLITNPGKEAVWCCGCTETDAFISRWGSTSRRGLCTVIKYQITNVVLRQYI